MFTRLGLKPLLMILMLVLSLGLLVAGCGDDDDSDSGSGDTTEASTDATTEEATTDEATTDEAAAATVLDIPAAETGLAYAVTEVTAPAGEITLRSVNDQSVPHNIAIDEPTQVIGEIVQDGGTSEITITIDEPGTYEFYCSVPGHREAGMVGTLTVT